MVVIIRETRNSVLGAALFLLASILFQFIPFLLSIQVVYAELSGPDTANEPLQSQNTIEATPANQNAQVKPQANIQCSELKQNLDKASKELQRLKQNLSDMEQENTRLKKELEKRPVEEMQTPALNKTLDTMKKELEGLQTQLTSIQNKNENPRDNNGIRWFMAGGGIFLIGMLTGFVFGRMKRKRPSLI
ncbi:MAG: TIGR04211 family SH3 domain-containing protein [Dissulfurimicrobium sp.]|uniref:TIGR04211 family SH3 domain-containing protein n=1 Tax=Dissulfurimicrobium sp. TaxID=2022436 RepID=UPI003D11CC39